MVIIRFFSGFFFPGSTKPVVFSTANCFSRSRHSRPCLFTTARDPPHTHPLGANSSCCTCTVLLMFMNCRSEPPSCTAHALNFSRFCASASSASFCTSGR